jgi:hypothetical protein
MEKSFIQPREVKSVVQKLALSLLLTFGKVLKERTSGCGGLLRGVDKNDEIEP